MFVKEFHYKTTVGEETKKGKPKSKEMVSSQTLSGFWCLRLFKYRF